MIELCIVLVQSKTQGLSSCIGHEVYRLSRCTDYRGSIVQTYHASAELTHMWCSPAWSAPPRSCTDYRGVSFIEVSSYQHIVPLQSKTHVVLASLKRAPSELSSYTQKVFKVDDHLAIATAGLAADGRILCRYLRNECINHRQAANDIISVATVGFS